MSRAKLVQKKGANSKYKVTRKEREEMRRRAEAPRNDLEAGDFFWDYKNGRLLLYNRPGEKEGGFSEEEAREIAPEILKKLRERRLKGIRGDYILIQGNGIPYYVMVENLEVRLPESLDSSEGYSNKKYIITADSRKIKGYSEYTPKPKNIRDKK